uniref:PHTB1_N domain-containing protein n=1 Tax=Heterorhabditis bacteriophora TaxID=37862 RepID=A0A1I7WZP1_HETBA
MSLFRLTEWYSNLIPSSSCLTVGSLIEEREFQKCFFLLKTYLLEIKHYSDDPSQLKMEEMFAHSLVEAAYNMCTIPAQSTTQILVQTIGCGLNLFQGENGI